MVSLGEVRGVLSKILGNFVEQIYTGLVGVLIVLVFLLIGYLVAGVITNIIKQFLDRVKLDEKIKKRNLDRALLGFSLSQIIVVILKVYIVFLFLGGAADVIKIGFFADMIKSFLTYIPSLVQGLTIIIAALMIAVYVSNTIKKEKKVALAHQIGLAVEILVGYIAVIIALPLLLPGLGGQVTILEKILELGISAIIIAVGLGVGLAIGLGIKDNISRAADKHQEVFDSLFTRLEKK